MAKVEFPIKNVEVKKGQKITPEMLGITPIVAENNEILLTEWYGNEGEPRIEGINDLYIGKDASYTISPECTKSASYRHSVDRLVFEDGITDLGVFTEASNPCYWISAQYEVTYPEGYSGDLVHISMSRNRPYDREQTYLSYTDHVFEVKLVIPKSLKNLDFHSYFEGWDVFTQYDRPFLELHVYLQITTKEELFDMNITEPDGFGKVVLYVKDALYRQIVTECPLGFTYDLYNVDTGETYEAYVDPNAK